MTKEAIKYCTFQIAENNDEVAFKALFTHFFNELVSYTNLFVKDKTVAAEIVEDVFLNIWKNRKMLHAVKSISYYLYVACKNGAYNYVTRQKNISSLPIDIDTDNIQIQLTTPESKLIEKDLMEKIMAAINELPPKCRLIFRMVKEEGLTYGETARLLELSPKTIEKQMNIAFKRIVTVIEQVIPGYKSIKKNN